MSDPLLDWLDQKAAALADKPEELERLREDLREVARSSAANHVAAAIQVRKVVEHLVRRVHKTELGDPGTWSLCDVIEALRTKNRVPQTVASYLHTIRRIGNDAAHNEMTRDDLYAGIMLLLLVCEWYFCAYEKGPQSETIYRPEVAQEPTPAVPTFDAALVHAEDVERLIRLAEAHPDDFGVALWIEKDGAGAPRRDFTPDALAPRLYLGDRATICARADRDCYLWIVDVGTTGRNAVLFPLPKDPDNRVASGEVIRIPGTVDGKTGLETVHAFASTVDLPRGQGASRGVPAMRDFLVDEEAVRRDRRRGHSAAATLQFAIDERGV